MNGSEIVSLRDDTGAPAIAEETPVLVCFPSVGLASTIVGHYLIRLKNLPRIATVKSPELVPASVIMDSLPNPSMRIHGDRSIAVLVSEFPPPVELASPLAESILDWVVAKKAGLVIAVEGILGKQQGGEENAEAPEDVFGIPSTPDAKNTLQKARVKLLDNGIVGGVAAALLNEASLRNLPIAVLFTLANKQDYPDHGAAARLLENIDRLLPSLKIDPQPLYDQAKMIERSLREGMKLHRASPPKTENPTAPEPSIYG